MADTKSGTGTWDWDWDVALEKLGRRTWDSGTPGLRDAGTRERGDVGRGDSGTHGDSRTCSRTLC